MNRTSRLLFGVSLIAAVTGVLLTMPKLSNASASKAEKSCKSCSQGTSTASVDWLKLVAGVTYHFTDLQLTPGTNPFWQTEYGTVNSSGDYTAPGYMPPLGLDTLSYTAADGSTASVTIRIVANPNLPDSGYPRYLRRTSTVLQSFPNNPSVYAYQLIGGASQAVLNTGEMNAISDGSPIPVLEPTDTYEAAVSVVDCVAIPVTVTTPYTQDAAVPATAVSTDSTLQVTSLVVTSPAGLATPIAVQAPQKCTPKPINPWPTGQSKTCTLPGGEHRIYGNWGKPSKKRIKDQDVSIEVNASVALDIFEKFGITVSAGVKYTGNRTLWEWTKSRKNDIYVCKNGVWTFSRTETCRITATGESTIPLWIAYVDGYPSNGDPGPWSSESCQ